MYKMAEARNFHPKDISVEDSDCQRTGFTRGSTIDKSFLKDDIDNSLHLLGDISQV